MDNINLRLRQNNPNAKPEEASDNANKQDLNGRGGIEQKDVEQTWKMMDDLEDQIHVLKDGTSARLQIQRNQMWKKLDAAFTTHEQELRADSLKKMQNDEDPLVREQSLNQNLEIMTHMAQQLDKEHRKLKKQEQKLKIQYSSQANDSDLLLKQIVYYRKQHKQIKEEHSRIKEELEKIQNEEEETDRKLASKLDKKKDGQNVNMPSIMNKKLSENKGNSVFGMHNSSSKGFQPAVPLNQPRVGTAQDNLGRPKTAGLMPEIAANNGGYRPQTGAVGFPNGLPQKNSLKRFAPAGAARAASAGFSQNQKLQRCEVLITRFKKKLEEERRLLRMMKTMSAQEIETKNQLEKILRLCVDDVKAEISKKRSENKSSYYARGKRGKQELREEQNLTAQEREKIIEVLMSQERVLTLLYDKTFPPRSQSTGFTGQLG